MRNTLFRTPRSRSLLFVSSQPRFVIPRCSSTTREDFASHLILLEKIAQQFGITQNDDWYYVTTAQFRKSGGNPLLHKFSNNLMAVLQTFYPEHEWLPWKFPHVPSDYWGNLKNQRIFFEWLGKQLQLKNLDDWYHVKNWQVRKQGGKSLLDIYDGSLFSALKTVFPEHQWSPWKFDKVPHKFWRSTSNQRAFLQWVGEQIGIQTWTDWYRVDSQQISKLGGASLLNLFSESVSHMLSTVFPEYEWHMHLFKRTARNLSHKQLKTIVEDVALQLQITELDEWYRVSKQQLQMFGASILWSKQHSLYQVLCEVYPHHSWNPSLFVSNRKKSSQRWLKIAVTKLFPNDEILEDYFHPDLEYKNSQYQMQLDIFLPGHRVAFEYQGEQHYRDHYFFGLKEMYEQKDHEKKIACQKLGITLIPIPFWWDKQDISLATIIAHNCPNLAHVVAQIITRSKILPENRIGTALEWDMEKEAAYLLKVNRINTPKTETVVSVIGINEKNLAIVCKQFVLYQLQLISQA